MLARFYARDRGGMQGSGQQAHGRHGNHDRMKRRRSQAYSPRETRCDCDGRREGTMPRLTRETRGIHPVGSEIRSFSRWTSLVYEVLYKI